MNIEVNKSWGKLHFDDEQISISFYENEVSILKNKANNYTLHSSYGSVNLTESEYQEIKPYIKHE